MKLRICWRGWHCSPLLIIGRYTLWFTNSISFGYTNAVHLAIYAGWLKISVDNYYDRSIAELTKHNFTHIWIVKYGK